MRSIATLLFFVLATPLTAASPAPAGRVAMGVGAIDSNAIVVRVEGKETAVTLANVKAGSPTATAFLKCLVGGRVVRVKGPNSAATVTLLDDTSVADHVNEFLQSKTSMDPCALGKAAYRGRRTSAG
jgi:hypothetical protein